MGFRIIALLMIAALSCVVYGRIPGNHEAGLENSFQDDDDSPVLVELDEEIIFDAVWNYFRGERSKRGITDYAQMGAGMVENKHYLSQGVEKGVGFLKGRGNIVKNDAAASAGENVTPFVLSYITLVGLFTFYAACY